MDDLTKCPPPVMNYAKLEVHPLAELIPEASNEEYKALKESIRKNGIRERIWLFEEKILDGRHRHRAGVEVGYPFKASDFRTFSGSVEQAKALSEELNHARRHLTYEQKVASARRMIEENPKASNRTIARRCGLSHVTIGNLKKENAEPDNNIDRVLERFASAWQQLDDQQQEGFVDRFKVDLQELLREV
jgi:hypothetical protein